MNENVIEIFDSKRVYVDSIESITEFTEEYIILKLKKYSLKIEGNEITFSDFQNGTAVIEGQIFSLSFLYL